MMSCRYKFKKTYLIFFISTFILGNILPGINSTIVANTNGLINDSNGNDNEIISQTDDASNEFVDLNFDKQALENERKELEDKQDEIISEHKIDSHGVIASGISGTVNWEIDADWTLKFGEGRLSAASVDNNPWKGYSSEIKKISFQGKCSTPVNGNMLFQNFNKVIEIENLENFDISTSQTVYSLFYNMSSLEELDVSMLDFSNITNVGSLFKGMSSLKSLKLGNMNTSKVHTMSSMFEGLSSLEELDVSMLDTSNVTGMSDMFRGMSSLTTLNLENFDTSAVKTMDGMFQNMTSLESLNMSSFDMSLAKEDGNLKIMFENDSRLSHLVLGPKVTWSQKERLPNIISNENYTGRWINVGEGSIESPKGKNKWTSTELLSKYNGDIDADTYVWEKVKLEVQTKPADIPLGTNTSDTDLNDFIESVKLDGVELSKDEYTIELKNSVKTTKIDNQSVELEVTKNNDESETVEVEATANIVWGSTLIAKDSSFTEVNSSVSLLHTKGAPYLNANEGTGLDIGILTTKPNFLLYRLEDKNPIFNIIYSANTNSPVTFLQKLNTVFEGVQLKYGDVLVMKNTIWGGNESWLGNNTFISRNNALVTETVGYDKAYYELTPSGYRLLRLNQLMVNNDQKVKLNTSKEEMNKDISNYIILPEHIENSNDFRMEFESVDTASPGNKKSTINVYETLESGGEFKTTYEVAYTVYPEITESYYDVNGKQIEQSQTTEFEYGKEFAPSPEKYMENNGVLYIYKGWVDALPGTGTIIPQEGIPAPTLVEKNYDYYYIYDKADKFINVTLPTEVVFGTFENNNKISSKKYEIKNNSDELPIEVSLEQFDKVTSDIKLLSSNTPDPTQEEASAKLNLCVDKESVIPGLTEDTPRQTITKIDTNSSRAISLEGTYFGNMSDKNILDYKMHLKFKATQDNKN